MRLPAPTLCLTLALLATGLLCSCEADREAFHLGGVGPKTGEAATYGISYHRAMQMAVAEWNARGGLMGEPIKLHFADDKGDQSPFAPARTWKGCGPTTPCRFLFSWRAEAGILD